ncbi:hypothetical protein DL93DRAFT_2099360 [Clavulina sp. PMI_390]|nr:hypothetical protein DL93DRAFT_2099360 [Clavulina sp. PMI_390]
MKNRRGPLTIDSPYPQWFLRWQHPYGNPFWCNNAANQIILREIPKRFAVNQGDGGLSVGRAAVRNASSSTPPLNKQQWLWSLSRYRIYVGMIVTMIVANLALAIDDNINGCLARSPTSIHHFQKIMAIVSLSAVIDLALAFGVVITLRKQRTGFIQMDRIINWIILYGIASGVVTSIFAFFILVNTLVGDPQVAIGAGMPFAGIYIGSTLAQLRRQLAGEHYLPTGGRHWHSSIEMVSPINGSSSNGNMTSVISTSTHSASHHLPATGANDRHVDDMYAIPEVIFPTRSHETIIEEETESLEDHHSNTSLHDELNVSTYSQSLHTPDGCLTPGSHLASHSETSSVALVPTFSPHLDPTELFSGSANPSWGREKRGLQFREQIVVIWTFVQLRELMIPAWTRDPASDFDH